MKRALSSLDLGEFFILFILLRGELWDILDDWYVMKDKLAHGRITQEKYDNWRYNFSIKDSSSIHASAPSEVLTDTKKKPKGKK
ncbi:MAG: hypothetical protein J6U54_24785 [Clostridiales bacterium]|nr:hypothetical protein [Clostridiales bacterium]